MTNSEDITVYQEHVPITNAFYIKSIDTKWQQPIEIYTGEDCITRFLQRMDYYGMEIRKKFKKIIRMVKLTDEQLKEHVKETNCYCCGIQFDEKNVKFQKVKDHCHITGQYRGAPCNYCNMNNLDYVAETDPIPVVFHTLQGYDLHHIL